MTRSTDLKTMKWRKINAPSTWRPAEGEELVGYYAGRTKREGSFGQYEVVVVLVPYKGAFMLSGTQLLQLMDAGMVRRGDAVRVVYKGLKQLDDEREMKMFELFVGELEAVDDVPDFEPPAPEPS